MANEVAKEIMAQLGGRFFAMVGAKNFMGKERGLNFDLPARFAANKATRVQIDLTAADLYDMRFYQWNARKLEMKLVGEELGIYADMVKPLFREATGLECQL